MPASNRRRVTALVLERNPTLKPDEVRAILMKTAHDLGPPGPDDQFGAGKADAFAAVSAVSVASMPVAAASEKPAGPDAVDARPAQAGNLPASTMAADGPDIGQTKPGTP
jgi:hypothetical protein